MGQYSGQQIMVACLHLRLVGHATIKFVSHASKSLDGDIVRLVFLLLSGEEDWHGDHQIIVEESCQKETLQIAEGFEGSWWEI